VSVQHIGAGWHVGGPPLHFGRVRKPLRAVGVTASLILAGLTSLAVARLAAAGDDRFQVTLWVDLGRDHGQAFGTLWEATNAHGKPMAGAGFLNAYNTQDRSDRRMLHVYVRTDGEDKFTLERLPRPTTDAGTYLFGFDGKLFAKGRNALDNKLRVWRPDTQHWEVDEQTVPFGVQVAGEVMAATARRVTFGDRTVLELAPSQGSIGEWYYAVGTLIVRRYDAEATPPVNELLAFNWHPAQRERLALERGVKLPFIYPREFLYAFGQPDDRIVVVSNMGGVHVFEGPAWRTLRVADPKTSFQVYSTLNTADRLLLGQYPTGELFEFNGAGLRRLTGAPPVMKGVSGSAREAQTLAIYGGDIYVGVWPWGEVWRQSGVDAQWRFLGRLFTHPEPTDKTTHPYEEETKRLDPVLNRWGQRVTSLVPLGDSLYLSTSAKGPNPYEEKFTFLAGDMHLEYGAVYRYRKPGCLAVPMNWKDGPTTLEFLITGLRIEVRQDREPIGAAEWDEHHPVRLEHLGIRRGAGAFGPFRGKRVELASGAASDSAHSLRVNLPLTRPADTLSPAPSGAEGSTRGARPLCGAYVHLNKMLDPDSDAPAQEATLRRELDRMKEFGLNAVLPFVTTSSGKAHYDSALLPGRTYAKSDPVKILAREARERGIEFHPVVPVVVCGDEQPAGILLQHPEWALRHPDGRAMGYVSPAHPEARKWLASVVREIVAKFQPDGVVLDYIRYANRPVRLDEAGEARFRKSLPPDCPTAEEKTLFQRFKEAELTELVREIADTTRAERSGVKLVAYCWGAHVAQDHQIAQVWPLWVERGYLDGVNISGYCHRETYGERFLQVFEQRLSEALERNRRLPNPAALSFALGVNTSHGRVHSADDIRQYLAIAERLKMDGVAYFTWEYLQPFLKDLKPVLR
jgi:uncharacterized lipoprotein YddW (UPF0748 family)